MTITIKERVFRLIVWILSLFVCIGCNREQEAPLSPDTPVRLVIDLQAEGHVLLSPLSSLEIRTPRTHSEAVGIGGIVVVHGIDNYYAYDLACPQHMHSYEGRLHPISSSPAQEGLLLYQCNHCKATYELAHGTGHTLNSLSTLPTAKPYPLIQYSVRVQESLLHISRR